MNRQQRLNNKQYITERKEKDELIEQILEAKRTYYNIRDKYMRKYGDTLYYETQEFKRKKSVQWNRYYTN